MVAGPSSLFRAAAVFLFPDVACYVFCKSGKHDDDSMEYGWVLMTGWDLRAMHAPATWAQAVSLSWISAELRFLTLKSYLLLQ